MTVTSPTALQAASAERRLGIGAVVLAVVCLSCGSSLVKVSGAPGPVVAFWRVTFGAVIWQVILRISGHHFSWALVKRLWPVGIAFGLNLVLFFSAARATRVANVEFIGALAPLVMVPVAAVALKEKPRWGTMAFAMPAIVGVALVVFGSTATGSSSTRGNLLAVGSVASWVAYLVLAKKRRGTVSVAELMATVAVVAAVVVLPFAAGTSHLLDLTAKAWAMCMVLAIVTGTVAHGLIIWAQKRVELGTISIIQVAQPALAAAWAWLLVDETVQPVQLAGMAIVVLSLGAFTVATVRR